MGRAKLRMELITKEKPRNTTYHKRKQGIIKKANEFTILCDVDTVIIIYPPNSDVPEIWPQNPDKIKKTIASYKTKKSDQTGKRTYDLHDFYEDRKKKIEYELVKARKKNIEEKYATGFDDLDGLTEGQLRQFAMGLENKENIVRAHLEVKKRNMNGSYINVQMPFMFDLENKMVQYQGLGLGSGSGSYPGLDHGQLMNHHLMNHGSFMPLKYPVFDGGMGYDNPNLNQWFFQPPVVHGGVMPEFARQEHDQSQVNNDVGEFVMDEHLRRFMGGI